MDLNKVIQDETASYISSDAFKEEVKANVKSMVNSRIKDALSNYGDIAKAMEDYIKKECVLDIKDLPAIGLSKLMIATVDEELNHLLKDDLKKRIVERVATITEPMPKEIKFFDIVKKIYEEKSRFDSCYCDSSDSSFEDIIDYHSLDSLLTVIVEDDKDDYWGIWFDDNENTSKNLCDYHIGIHKKDGYIVFYNGAGSEFGRNNEKPLNRFYGVASCLYKLQVQDSKVDVDSVQEFIDNYL